jgi:hypothetical protein
VHSSLLVTHSLAQASFCASSPDASPATPGPERYFPAPESSFGSPLWPAIDVGSVPWQPCDTPALHNGAGDHDYGKSGRNNSRQCRHLHFTLRFIGRLQLCPASSKKPHRPDQKITRPHNLKNPKNNTQEEECCPEAFEEDLRPTKRDFQTGRFTRFSNRR